MKLIRNITRKNISLITKNTMKLMIMQHMKSMIILMKSRKVSIVSIKQKIPLKKFIMWKSISIMINHLTHHIKKNISMKSTSTKNPTLKSLNTKIPRLMNNRMNNRSLKKPKSMKDIINHISQRKLIILMFILKCQLIIKLKNKVVSITVNISKRNLMRNNLANQSIMMCLIMNESFN